MIVDFDDFCRPNHRLDLLYRLHDVNPRFRCTLFAIPGLGDDHFWSTVPTWCELAVHGFIHGEPATECHNWSRERMEFAIETKPDAFVDGFKAPGWQISDGCYEALDAAGWWVADQSYNDQRRPASLRVHRLDDGEHWHGHIQNVCGNGLEETFLQLMERVRRADTFQLISEVVEPWAAAEAA